jgi:hypothetical protein
MIVYKFRESDHVYVGPVEMPDAPFIPPFHTRTAPPEQDGHYAVMRNGWMLVEGEVPDDPALIPLPVPVPQQVTMRQARLALLQAGLLSSVDAAIDGLPEPDRSAAKIEWEYAAVVQRASGLVPAMGAALGMTEAQIDALFILAATL